MTVVIDRNGALLDAIIDRSSGSAVLDRAPRRIVKLAAPYPRFPPEIAHDTDLLPITRTWMFPNVKLRPPAASPPLARQSTIAQPDPSAVRTHPPPHHRSP